MLRTDKGTIDFTGAMLCLGNVFLYFLCRNLLTGDNIKYFLFIFISSVFAQLIFAYCRQYGGFNSYLNFRGNFFNSGLFAGYLAMGIVAVAGSISLFPAASGPQRCWKWVYLLVPALAIPMLVALFYSQSRAALLALAAGILFLLKDRLISLYKKMPNRFARWLSWSMALLLLVGVMAYLYSLRPDSANGRLLIWQAGWNMFCRCPFLGWGFDGFRRNYMFFQEKLLAESESTRFINLASDNGFAFNEFLKLGVEQGLTGVVAVLFILGLLFRRSRMVTYCPERLALKSILLSLLVFGCFSYPSEAVPFQVVMVAGIAGLACISGTKSFFVCTLGAKAARVLGLCLLLGGSVTGVHVWKLARTAAGYQNLIARFSGKDEEFARLRSMYPLLNTTIDYLAFYGEEANNYGRPEEALEIFQQLGKCFPTAFQQRELGKAWEAMGDFEAAERAYLRANGMMPLLIGPHYLLARLYELGHRYEKACVQSRFVLEMKPIVYTPEVYYMKKEMKHKLHVWKSINEP